MTKQIWMTMLFAGFLASCGGSDGDSAATTSPDESSNTVVEQPADEPAQEEPPVIDNPIVDKPVVTTPDDGEMLSASASVSDPTSMRDLSTIFDQFDINMADMQMIHDVMTGRPSGNQPNAGVIPYLLDNPEAKLTCETLTKLFIDRIFLYNDGLQASGGLPISGVVMINPNAMQIARDLDAQFEADLAAGHVNGGLGDRYLHCMPILLKDNFDTFDHPSSQASPSMFGHQAGKDAVSVDGMRKAGAVILGKAQQDEFAYFTLGFSGRTVRVTNPYNTAESPGGSSSGTGASIGARFAVGGTGSDTCMSIRLPSSVNGLVGIRPSIGVVSRDGIFPLNHVRDTGGPMTKTVRDTALQLTAMASQDPDIDPAAFPFAEDATGEERFVRPDSYLEYLDRDQYGIKGRKIGVITSVGGSSSAGGTATQGDMILTAAAKMMAMGAEVYQVIVPDFSQRSAGRTHYDMNQYFFEFFEKGGESPRRCLTSVGGATFGSDDRHPSCVGIEGIVETLRTGPRTAGLLALSAGGSGEQNPAIDAQLQAVADERKAFTDVLDGIASTQYANASVRKFSTMQEILDNAPSGENIAGTGVELDAGLMSPGPSGYQCGIGSTTQMGSIVVPLGIDDGPGTPRGVSIFVRRFDEGNGLGIAFDLEQQLIDERLGLEEPVGGLALSNGGQGGYLLAPALTPDPLYTNQTIGSFNTRIKKAMMTAPDEAPEQLTEFELEAAISALAEILGNSEYD